MRKTSIRVEPARRVHGILTKTVSDMAFKVAQRLNIFTFWRTIHTYIHILRPFFRRIEILKK